ncbi:MAG: hypothetical protein H2044_01395 [Rhizobiales bacterium]|nr:hypothetical protein [Hyphomicrobiales bacterium]
MPFDSNGNYTLPTSYFVENGDTVLPIQHNPPFEDVAQALSLALLRDGRSPMTGDLSMGSKKIINLADASAMTDAVTKQQLDAVKALQDDPWAFQPLGVPIPASMGITGTQWPPNNNPRYRYIILTAGQTGSGGYNNGVLTSEGVSGSWPAISASAVISLAGSPFNGRQVQLINTSRTFLRPGNGGVHQYFAVQSHTHGVNDPGHVHGGVQNGTSSTGRSTAVDQPPAVYSFGNTWGATTGIWLSYAGDEETRVRNFGLDYVMRIK